MIEVGKLFYKYSNPLKEVEYPEVGEVYYNVEGQALKCLGNNEYELVEGSPLHENEIVTDLNPKQLKLFWILVKNKNIYGVNIMH